MQAIPHTPTVCCIHPQHHNGHIRCLGSASRLLDVRLPRTFTHTPRHCTARDSSREHTPRPNTTHQHTTHTMTTRQRLPERGAMAPRLETAPSLRRTPTTHTRVAHSTTTCIDNWPSRSQPLRTHTHSTQHTSSCASHTNGRILNPHPQSASSMLNPQSKIPSPPSPISCTPPVQQAAAPSLPATARAAHALGAPQYPGNGGGAHAVLHSPRWGRPWCHTLCISPLALGGSPRLHAALAGRYEQLCHGGHAPGG